MRLATHGREVLRRAAILLALVPLLAAPAGVRAAACLGDCGNDGGVAVDELVASVRILLALTPAGQCPGTGSAGAVTLADVEVGVLNALDGCPDFSGSYEAGVPLSQGAAEISLTVAADGEAAGQVRLPAGGALRAGGGAAQILAVGVGGFVDFATGEFLLTGSYVDGAETVPVRLSGRLPRPGDHGAVRLEVGDAVYTSSFVGPPAPTPTPTPPSGVVHVVEVGKVNLPFDPELVEIDPGDTVRWVWVGGSHSVVSTQAGAGGFPNCTPDGAFDSGVRAGGTFEHTFASAGTYEYHCGVAGHCDAFETGVVIVRGSPSPTRTFTATATPTFALPTTTPTPATVGGVSVRMLGFFEGRARNDFGGDFPERVQILVDDFGPLFIDLTGNVIAPSATVRMQVVSPTMLSFSDSGGLDPRSLELKLEGDGRVTGTYTIGSMGMQFHVRLDLSPAP